MPWMVRPFEIAERSPRCGSLHGMSTEWMDERSGEEADDLEFDEELEAQWDAEWDEAERDAVAVLREALADRVGAPPPARPLSAAAVALRAEIAADRSGIDWVVRATGLPAGELPDDDAELLISLTAATISPQEDTGLDLEQEATLISLEHPDWLGAIVTTSGVSVARTRFHAVVLPCGSVSTIPASCPACIAAKARLTVSVLLPTPPLPDRTIIVFTPGSIA